MSRAFIRKALFICASFAMLLPAFFCNSPQQSASASEEHPSSPWLNVYDTSAHYVGMDACRGCHPGVYETFMQTGMGQSFASATRQKSAADFTPGHALVYDTLLDYYYRPFWKGEKLFILEYRLSGKDTIHRLEQQVDYVVGSGQHTNSHIFNVNGYLYQAPITYYTQKKQWDLAPGFEKGASSRFRRMIQLECMSCHNAYPNFVPNSENKYTNVMSGIDCERCHGPGSLHLAARQSSPPVDTSKTPDYTIVNPRRLSTELQNNVCQRCHLQGISVLNDGKTYFDFRPGMKLSEVMNVFMPEYEGAQDKMIMASHVERMKKSNCYVSSGKMSCITCHKPHVSVKFTPRAQYLSACQGCHTAAGQSTCKESPAARSAKNDDCVTCHMPRNGSIDIPHVAVTDHYIRKRPMAETEVSKITAFLGMKCYNNDNPDAITKARGFMEFYERYTPSAPLIDSALIYIGMQVEVEAAQKQNRDFIRAWYLKNDYNKVIGYVTTPPADITDAWTAYRIGEAYFQTGRKEEALPWYKRATELWKYALDFQNKYGTCLLALGNADEAKKVFEFIRNENPNYVSANTNLGFIYLQQGNGAMAYDLLSRANELGPDHEQTLINLAVWHYGNKNYDKARKHLQHLLVKHPNNEQAKMMIADLDRL